MVEPHHPRQVLVGNVVTDFNPHESFQLRTVCQSLPRQRLCTQNCSNENVAPSILNSGHVLNLHF